jgi:hypothetical protein
MVWLQQCMKQQFEDFSVSSFQVWQCDASVYDNGDNDEIEQYDVRSTDSVFDDRCGFNVQLQGLTKVNGRLSVSYQCSEGSQSHTIHNQSVKLFSTVYPHWYGRITFKKVWRHCGRYFVKTAGDGVIQL